MAERSRGWALVRLDKDALGARLQEVDIRHGAFSVAGYADGREACFLKHGRERLCVIHPLMLCPTNVAPHEASYCISLDFGARIEGDHEGIGGQGAARSHLSI